MLNNDIEGIEKPNKTGHQRREASNEQSVKKKFTVMGSNTTNL